VAVDGKLSRRIVLIDFHLADLDRSFLASSFLSLFVYLLYVSAWVNNRRDRFALAPSSSTFRSIYEKHRHTVIYTFLDTSYDGSNGRTGLGPHLKADRINGRTPPGRRSRWPRTSCSGLAAPGRPHKAWRR
jgi:hypothetical protein